MPSRAGQAQETRRRQYVCEGACRRSPHKLEYNAEITGQQSDADGGQDEKSGEDDVPPGMERFSGEKKLGHDIPAYKCLERKGGEHVQRERQACKIHHCIICWEVVQDVSLCLGPEGEIPRQRHRETSQHADERAGVRDDGEAVEGGRAQRAVDQEAVVVADESKGYDADGREEAREMEEGFRDGATEGRGLTGPAEEDGQEDEKHGEQGKG